MPVLLKDIDGSRAKGHLKDGRFFHLSPFQLNYPHYITVCTYASAQSFEKGEPGISISMSKWTLVDIQD